MTQNIPHLSGSTGTNANACFDIYCFLFFFVYWDVLDVKVSPRTISCTSSSWCVVFAVCIWLFPKPEHTAPPRKEEKRNERQTRNHFTHSGNWWTYFFLCLVHTCLLMWSKWPAVRSQVAQSNQKQNKNPSRLCLMIGSYPMRALGLYGPTALKWRGGWSVFVCVVSVI